MVQIPYGGLGKNKCFIGFATEKSVILLSASGVGESRTVRQVRILHRNHSANPSTDCTADHDSCDQSNDESESHGAQSPRSTFRDWSVSAWVIQIEIRGRLVVGVAFIAGDVGRFLVGVSQMISLR